MLRALLPLLAAGALSAAEIDLAPDATPEARPTVADAAPAVSLDAPRTPAETVEALAQIGQRRLVNHRDLVDASLDASEPAVQVAALRALGALGADGDAERAKARALITSPRPEVRAEAVRCAGGDREAVPALADALNDPATSKRAHEALVRIAAGTDLGFDAQAWKAWHEKRTAAAAEALAALKARLSSPDHAEVLAALPTVAVIDLDRDAKKSLIAPLRGDPDPAIASVAAKVWTAVAGPATNPADAAPSAPAAIVRPAAPATFAAPVVAMVRRKLAAGDIASLVGLALVMIGGTAGVLWALYRTSRKMTRAFTAAIAVKLKPKNIIKQITQAIRNPKAVVKQVTTAIRNPRRVAKSITEAIRRPKAKTKAPAPAPTEDREVAPAITEAIAKAHK